MKTGVVKTRSWKISKKLKVLSAREYSGVRRDDSMRKTRFETSTYFSFRVESG